MKFKLTDLIIRRKEDDVKVLTPSTDITNIPQQIEQPTQIQTRTTQTPQQLSRPPTNDPIQPLLKNIMSYAEIIGIDKQEVGRTALKALITGKLNYKEPKVQRTPFEKVMQVFYDGWFFWTMLFIMYVILRYIDRIWA